MALKYNKGFTLAEVFSTHFRSFRKCAFTLAEVLITLGIIGVVAALTLPNLIANYKEKQAVVALKKITSELTQVSRQLDYEYGGNWTIACDKFDDVCFRDLFAEKMNVIKKCENPISEGCQISSKYLDGAVQHNTGVNHNWPAILTNSGYSIKFRFHFNGCEPQHEDWDYGNLYCGWVQIDTNGLKHSNVVGKDIFYLFFYKHGKIVGANYSEALSAEGDVDNYDYSKSVEELEEDCYKGTGISCSSLFLMK